MQCEANNQAISHDVVKQFIIIGLLLGLTLWLAPQRGSAGAEQGQAVTADSTFTAFNERVKEYIKLRDKLEGQLPKLSSKSQPAEIEEHLVALQKSIIVAREGAKPGDIFTPEAADSIRSIIKQEFKGARLRKLRETVREAETKGVPLRVNVPYPETKELIEMPPTLLLKLPTLPKQLHFHFVGRSLLLIDKEARLIVDYLPGALP